MTGVSVVGARGRLLLLLVRRRGGVGLAGLQLVRAALPVMLALSVGRLVAELLEASTVRRAVLAACLVAGLFLVDQLVWLLIGPVRTLVVKRIDGDVRGRVRRRAAGLRGLDELESAEFQDRAARAVDVGMGMGRERSPGNAAAGQLELLARIASATAAAVLVATFSVPLAVGLLGGALAMRAVVRRQWMAIVDKLDADTAGQRYEYYVSASAVMGAAKDVRLFGLSDWFAGRFRAAVMRTYGPVWRAILSTLRRQWWIAGLSALAAVAALGLPAAAVLGGELDPGRLITIVLAAFGVLSITGLGMEAFDIEYGQRGLAAADELDRLYEDKSDPRVDAAPDGRHGDARSAGRIVGGDYSARRELARAEHPGAGAVGGDGAGAVGGDGAGAVGGDGAAGEPDQAAGNGGPRADGRRGSLVDAGLETGDGRRGDGRRGDGWRGGQGEGAGRAPVVRFEGVSFTYPGGREPVLDGLSVTLRAGETVAIVGANGAGKTTLVKLLAGLYQPTAGRISVDGVDPRRRRPPIAALFQDFVRYPGTLRDNVAATAPHQPDDDGVRAAIGKADAPDLPLGTSLWREGSDGTDLSGGQWQRVALARVLYAVGAGRRLLVLDEPTAHLDVRAEAEFHERVVSRVDGATTILISHRLSTVRPADRILLLRDGRIAEDGTHDELIALGGDYARFFLTQAAAYARGERP